ncbi:putative polyketide synthase [Pseudomassariella vexata]|uniref:Putative polyketide synthase n=1 Tax=Pseudomassariella vexata TaxID=1141098 RepID=A0A1Y2EBN6_9PEZI|nr:putative polyketide synthase [Pseudomassariella vexata]ORY68265.1 putative polyketide synthase [Pseudomassariella vexata]
MPFLQDDGRGELLEPVAIVGMSCRLPGSVDSSSKFWDTLRENKSVRTPKSFDPTFFNMTPVEAQWLDPQQRKMLEVCYECLENAGLPLDKVAGSKTGVYVATFTSDYQQMSVFERDYRHNYAATGVDTGIISNRINNVFNFDGPSFTINTACSSAMYAIHNACHALRAGDCDAAIAGGVNLILTLTCLLTQDQHMNTAKLGVLSPTSECHTFDASADGYGRAEGVGALYLKRLSHAIRDKDVIRGVIRSTAVNTNGKVEGMGITFPNMLGQERVLRDAYARADLDPNQTAYLECHGTGTPAGDPIEVRAVSNGMNDTRDSEKPLLLGAAKTNIGHSEAASGIFATMKAALMTEKALIPAVHGLKTLNPNIKEEEWNVKIVRELMPWPSDFNVRRASVSSFGYGGTNAHLVLESVLSMCPWYEHGQPKATAKYQYGDIDRPFLVTMSAHDDKTLKMNIHKHQQVAGNYYLPDLAYSLNCRRSRFAARGYTTALAGQEIDAFSSSSFSYGTKISKPVKLGFVFTGQGAQWARMGYEAIQKFAEFGETIDALDRVLQRINPRPTWTLRAVLEAPVESSRVNESEISQPACTAIQIAVIDLFASWNIEPVVTIGHSSGEIAAAYAAGRLSAPEAMLAAYFRGFAVAKAAPAGTMLAVGLGAEEVWDHVPDEVCVGVTIACENSPSSVTLSGDFADIAAVQQALDKTQVFNRPLKTGKAYHSPQMDTVAPLYSELYTKASEGLKDADFCWRRPHAGMISSVTGTEAQDAHLGISYWCENLRGRVLFNTALRELGNSQEYADVNVLLEIGPHAALGGPIKQICAANSFEMQYVGSLRRGADSATALLKSAGELYLKGLEIDFESVNNFKTSNPSILIKRSDGPRYLPDLPPYQWNYETTHWFEPRSVAELRKYKHPRHDILGRRIFGLSTNDAVWRNVLRQRDVPWFADHTLGSDAVFPAAGYMSMAIEALLQQLDLEPRSVGGVKFRDIDISKALVVPDTDNGVEVLFRLEKLPGGTWYSFNVESVENGLWTLHSSGKIQKQITDASQSPSACPHKLNQLHQQVSGKRWYRSLHRVGFRYGPNFQTMTSVKANGKDRMAAARVQVQVECGNMEQESRYVLHPSTLDGCLHAVIASVHRGLHKVMPWGVVPLEIEEMTVNFSSEDLNVEGECMAWTDRAWDRYFNGNAELFGSSGKCLLNIRNMKFVVYDAAVPPSSKGFGPKEPYRRVAWEKSENADEALQTEIEVDGKVVVLHNASDSSSMLGESLGATCISLQGAAKSTDGFDKIIIDDSDGSIMAAATEESFEFIKETLQSGKPIVWVTRGVNQGNSVDGGIPQGLLRAVRSELVSARVALVDADEDTPMDKLASVVHHQLESVDTKDSGADVEFWLTGDSTLLVSRIETNDSLNQLLHQELPYEQTVISTEEGLKGKIADNEVLFESQQPTSQCLRPQEVEIQVHYSELAKEDLSVRTAERARLITGTIIRIGNGLETNLQGQAVVAYTKQTFETRLITSTFAQIDAENLAAVAASLPYLAQAVDAVLLTGHATAGSHVLLLSSSAPFADAVLKLGQKFKFRVTKADDDDLAKIQQLLSASGGPNIVVAAAPSSLIADVWCLMPRNSKLVFSDIAIEGPLDSRPFSRGAGLAVCGISHAFERDQAALERLLDTSVEILGQSGGLFSVGSSPSVIDVENLLDVDEARKCVLETGANVLGFKYMQSQIKTRKSRKPVCFSPTDAYLLVGSLGGLGRSLTTWMFERGCRNFVFLSRSGIKKPEAADVVERLKESGASVYVFCVDASDEKAVAGVVAEVSGKKPIKGVVHAAMVLEDGLYQTMTLPEYNSALRPKMQGALALHKALDQTPLDFFIMTSSISAVLGNPGQANYCAGNSYLDFLALYRRKRGLAATSLALPMVEDVGVVAENTHIAEALARKTPFSIDEREMLVAFEAAIIQGRCSGESKAVDIGDAQVILGLEPEAITVLMEGTDMSDAYWMHDARMTTVRAALDSISAASGAEGQEGTGSGGGFVATLAGKTEEEALNDIGVHIINRTARILGLQPEGFKMEEVSVANHGIDSMIGVELQSWLFKEFGLQVSIQTISNPNTTFKALARMAGELIGFVA